MKMLNFQNILELIFLWTIMNGSTAISLVCRCLNRLSISTSDVFGNVFEYVREYCPNSPFRTSEELEFFIRGSIVYAQDGCEGPASAALEFVMTRPRLAVTIFERTQTAFCCALRSGWSSQYHEAWKKVFHMLYESVDTSSSTTDTPRAAADRVHFETLLISESGPEYAALIHNLCESELEIDAKFIHAALDVIVHTWSSSMAEYREICGSTLLQYWDDEARCLLKRVSEEKANALFDALSSVIEDGFEYYHRGVLSSAIQDCVSDCILPMYSDVFLPFIRAGRTTPAFLIRLHTLDQSRWTSTLERILEITRATPEEEESTALFDMLTERVTTTSSTRIITNVYNTCISTVSMDGFTRQIFNNIPARLKRKMSPSSLTRAREIFGSVFDAMVDHVERPMNMVNQLKRLCAIEGVTEWVTPENLMTAQKVIIRTMKSIYGVAWTHRTTVAWTEFLCIIATILSGILVNRVTGGYVPSTMFEAASRTHIVRRTRDLVSRRSKIIMPPPPTRSPTDILSSKRLREGSSSDGALVSTSLFTDKESLVAEAVPPPHAARCREVWSRVCTSMYDEEYFTKAVPKKVLSTSFSKLGLFTVNQIETNSKVIIQTWSKTAVDLTSLLNKEFMNHIITAVVATTGDWFDEDIGHRYAQSLVDVCRERTLVSDMEATSIEWGFEQMWECMRKYAISREEEHPCSSTYSERALTPDAVMDIIDIRTRRSDLASSRRGSVDVSSIHRSEDPAAARPPSCTSS
jgi:hypothetical protein